MAGKKPAAPPMYKQPPPPVGRWAIRESGAAWSSVLEALEKGLYARHSNWVWHTDGVLRPTALRLKSGRFQVCPSPSEMVPGQENYPVAPQEMQSSGWQIVEWESLG